MDIKYTEKFRETIDPYSLSFPHFKLKSILGYPPAGNDVFYVNGDFMGKNINAFLKVERQNGADIENELSTLAALKFDKKPQVLEFSFDEPKYILTLEAEGERLSQIVGNNENMQSLEYMEEYGETLAYIHSLKIDAQEVKHRKFFDIPENTGLDDMESFLQENAAIIKSAYQNKCFCHGDAHYANILWKNHHISCVLDYELSGIGIREFDMAWAVFLRPSQKFLKTEQEIDAFLLGYNKLHYYSELAFMYYYVLIGTRFYNMGDEEYKQDVRLLLDMAVKRYKKGLKIKTFKI